MTLLVSFLKVSLSFLDKGLCPSPKTIWSSTQHEEILLPGDCFQTVPSIRNQFVYFLKGFLESAQQRRIRASSKSIWNSSEQKQMLYFPGTISKQQPRLRIDWSHLWEHMKACLTRGKSGMHQENLQLYWKRANVNLLRLLSHGIDLSTTWRKTVRRARPILTAFETVKNWMYLLGIGNKRTACILVASPCKLESFSMYLHLLSVAW